MASIRTTVQPAVEPVSLADVKTYLRVDNTAEDAIIAQSIRSAREWCEERTGRRLITQTVEWVLDLHWKNPGVDVPQDPDLIVPERYQDKMIRSGLWIYHQPHVQFPIIPVQQITNFTYRLNGTDVAYDMTNMRVEPEGMIVFDPYALPPLSDEQFGAFTITGKVGYGDTPDTIPASFIQAMMMLLGHWYENRGIYYETALNGRLVPAEMAAAVTQILSTKRKFML